jgi:membrane protein DedA with SNARE-associated domain
MDDTIQILLQYGYVVLFTFVLAEQVGLPIPAVPVLLGVGALAGAGRMSLVPALCVALVASLVPDVVWYELGRRRGGRVLRLLCRISLEPDSCIRRAEDSFVKHGRGVLLIAKFFPGLSTVAPPLAGVVGISRRQFILLDSAAALVWAGAWGAVGYAFSDALELIVADSARLGNLVLVVAVGGLVLYIAIKFTQRQLFLRSLRIARITVDELRERLASGDGGVAVVDTRSPLELKVAPYTVPGARWIAAEDIDRRHLEIPRDREIVVYCT